MTDGFEIDFLSVEDETRSGYVICIRYGNEALGYWFTSWTEGTLRLSFSELLAIEATA